MRKGFVSLVGAGPGDPGLLTVKALERLREADLIIYDYLVNPEHLRHARRDCATLCVGKGFRHKKMSQQKINRLIIQKARLGKKVVRLKGGDPYLFGRGGEEALFLRKHSIPFDVVPGVTSATACANYAGIPLTHREHNASVTFLTGHRAADGALDSIDWARIAAIPGTLVIYMGFYNLAVIAKNLLRHGMKASTSAAVIEWGTLPRQKTCVGPLSEIAARVGRMKLEPPCLIVIGDVVKLRPRLDWYEQLPLFGKKILVTRSQDKAGVLSQRLRALGAEAVELPTLEIHPVRSAKPLDTALRALRRFDWLVFTSTYGVDAFFGRLEALKKDARSLAGLRVACVGPETAKALRAHGVEPDALPRDFETKELVPAIRKKAGSLRGLRILLVRTNIAPKELETRLEREGARTHRVTGYLTKRARVSRGLLRSLAQNPPDYLTFASSSSVKNLSALLGPKKLKRLARRSVVASIGPVTSGTLRAMGLRVGCQASSYHIDGLVSALTLHARRRR